MLAERAHIARTLGRSRPRPALPCRLGLPILRCSKDRLAGEGAATLLSRDIRFEIRGGVLLGLLRNVGEDANRTSRTVRRP